MKKIPILVALSVLLLATLACSFGGPTQTPTPPPPTLPPPTLPPPTQAPLTGNQVILSIINNMSAKSICEVYITPPDSDTWGDNRLGSSDSIASGSFFNLPVDPGTYDLRAKDCDQNVLGYEWDVDLTKPADWTIADPVALTINNNMSSKSVCYIYIARPETDTWGGNWLGSNESIASGSTFDLQVNPAIYDLRAKDCDQNVLAYEWSVDLTKPVDWTISDPVALTIKNTSAKDVCSVYITRPDTGTWGENWLGSDQSIASGSTFTLQVNPGTYDLEADDCDKNVLSSKNGVDLTKPQDWTVSDK